MGKRLDWIDQARGLSIFLVIYGHNFPYFETYIYSFHVPLFFFISGMFHPKKVNIAAIKRRAKMILAPYFIWAFVLYGFWFFLGRNFGISKFQDLSALDNFIGIFYSQGGQAYMDWGIPIWFLPCIFMVFLIFSLFQRISNRAISVTLVVIGVLIGFIWPWLMEIHLPWSLDVALVSMGFYAIGKSIKNWLIGLNNQALILSTVLFFAIHITTFYFNISKVDMYRSLYGEETLFFISGLTGSMAYILLFKLLPAFKFLSYLGKHTIVLLAAHTRALTLIKLIILLITGIAVFNFSETEKLLLTLAQIILVIPVIWLVNKYIPILDGKVKKP